MKIDLDWYELLLWLIYVIAGGGLVFFYKSFYGEKVNKYIFEGYFVKILGGFVFAMIYVYYYPGGDTTEYYLGSKELVNIFYENPKLYFEVVFSEREYAKKLLIQNGLKVRYIDSSEEWFMIRISSPLNLLGFNSYLGMTFFFSILSFFGSLFMSKTMNQILPNHEKLIFRINFLIPTVLVWGSGVLKDTITLFCFSFIVYLFYRILKNKDILKNIILSIIPFYVIFIMKAYIIICFLPWIFISLFFVLINKSQNPVIKFLAVPYLGLMVGSTAFFSSSSLIQSSADYKAENIITKIQGFHSWHQATGGSYYNLGEVEYTEFGLISKFPQAVNVTLFRPYPWESSSSLIFLNSLESFLLLIFVIYIFSKYRLNFFTKLSKEPFLLGALFFCLFFAFAIGLSSYNFGALSRFKIPITALFLFLFIFVIVKMKNEKSTTE
jgi:hypothetical protein